jgi:hypothetical protein
LPGSVPSISPSEEKSLLTSLLEGLCTLFKLDLETLPNLSRDPSIFPLGAPHHPDDRNALCHRGSNTYLLANSATTLVIIGETIITSGRILARAAVTVILAQVEAFCASMQLRVMN